MSRAAAPPPIGPCRRGRSGPWRRGRAGPCRLGRSGFSLLEVLVAIVILEVGLLGVLGLLTLAVRGFTAAVALERASAEAGAVADSLSRVGALGAGASVRGEWRITWEPEGSGGFLVRAAPAEGGDARTIVELRVP